MCEMPMERTVGLSIVPTAISSLRTGAVSVIIYTTLTTSEQRRFQNNRHISSVNIGHPSILFNFSVKNTPFLQNHKNYFSEYVKILLSATNAITSKRKILLVFSMKIRSSVHINSTYLQNITCKQYETFLFMSKKVHSNENRFLQNTLLITNIYVCSM